MDDRFCPYCLVLATRPRAVYCSDDHAQRAANERARGRYRRARNTQLVLAQTRERVQRDAKWRQAIREPDAEAVAQFAFGIAPDPHVAHGDTLDSRSAVCL